MQSSFDAPRLHIKQRKFSEVTHGVECNKRYQKQIQKVNEFGDQLRSARNSFFQGKSPSKQIQDSDEKRVP